MNTDKEKEMNEPVSAENNQENVTNETEQTDNTTANE